MFCRRYIYLPAGVGGVVGAGAIIGVVVKIVVGAEAGVVVGVEALELERWGAGAEAEFEVEVGETTGSLSTENNGVAVDGKGFSSMSQS